MTRERALKVVMVLVGLLFVAGVYPLMGIFRGHFDPADSGDFMMLSLYVTLGVFLLVAVRNPAGHRSLIAFTAWSSFAHAVVMSTLGLQLPAMRTGFLVASAVLVMIGVVLLVLMPGKRERELLATVAGD